MASPYQQQALQRKLIYLGSVVVLFSVAWLWRHYDVERRADDLAVREINRGDVQLSDKAVRLTVSGMRGPVTAYLWMKIIDEQKRREWNNVEEDVRDLIVCQPYMITPWIFQSWNLSYNVSVALDRTSDKYYFIARGIEFLAEGERQNHDNPDIRWSLAFTYSHKICQHDETNVLRSLFQLSCIPPNERDPSRFLIVGEDGRSDVVNMIEFEQFCKDHPQLIRRLYGGIQRDTDFDTQRPFRCQTPRAVVQFLADNYKILSLYETPPPAPPNGWVKTPDKYLEETERFPILPPPPGKPPRLSQRYDEKAIDSDTPLNESHDAYAVSRAWFGYAIEAAPPPGDIPGENREIKEADRLHQRVPKGKWTSIFRQQSPRAASYMAERLQEEGWFDKDPDKSYQAWPIPDWFEGNKFSDGTTAEARVESVYLSKEAWAEAVRRWERHGRDNHFLFTDNAEESRIKQRAEEFRKRHRLPDDSPLLALREEDLPASERDEYRAYRFLFFYNLHRKTTNFPRQYQRALIEQNDATVLARKLFYEADTQRLNATPHEARKRYENPAALAAWRTLLLAPGNEDYRDDPLIQDKTAAIQLKYLAVVNEVLPPLLPWAFPLPVRITPGYPGWIVKSPFLDDKGESIVPAYVLKQVADRRAKKPGAKPPPQPAEIEPPPN